jgi:predicted AlkP superfamily pyrophosphatase or phosphodiesterase
MSLSSISRGQAVRLWRTFWTALLLCVWFLSSCVAAQPPAPAKPPRLVVVLVVDQFRYDYLTRFRSQYTAGLATLWNKGAVFTNAHLQHFPTVTAVGHATILTGATPALSGIVGNEWYDRDAGRSVTSVFDPKAALLGTPKGNGASPVRLMVSTVGDELKMAGKGPSKVIGISLKDRAAILPAGRMADAAYWFDTPTGNLISSTYYFPDLPAWVKEFNARRLVDQHAGAVWKSAAGKPVRTLPGQPGRQYYDALERSPFGIELLIAFAERAIEAERLGADDATDILSISFSSTDLLGHAAGPDSPEIRELNLQTDRLLGQFLQYLDKRPAPGSTLVVFTADHGVAPLPEVQAGRKMPGGRIIEADLRKTVEAALTARFGAGKWVGYSSSGAFWLDRDTIRQKRLKQAEVEDCAAEALAGVPHVLRVYTGTRLQNGWLVPDRVGRRVADSFCPSRSADVIGILEPYWIYGAHDTSHGAAYSYDTHVPLIFMGPGIKPGKYHQDAAINDIAPTLATILEVETPSGSSGRVLGEMLVR